MSGQTLHTDIAIIGGGAAGLWALNQLRNRGYSAILFEQQCLGGYQTMGSQGIIHGGIKYALGGAWSGGSAATAAMPATWRACLGGEGKVDLRNCKVLSEDFFLWSGASLSSRLTSFLASKVLAGRVEPVAPADYPAPLQSDQFQGRVYRLVELVIDIPSLVATLAGQQRDAIFRIDWQIAALRRDANRAVLDLPGCTVVPRRLLLMAGVGNEALISALGCREPAMQRRPLQQVLVKHQYRDPFYAHCIGSNPTPRLTISSHRTASGEPLWYLGGDLATAGADEEPAELINRARRELQTLLPWLDLGASQWRTLRLERAERGPTDRTASSRPDSAFVGMLDGVDNTLAAWPTKLSLSPQLADAIEQQLEADNILPRHQPDLALLATLGQPPLAAPYWDTLFQCAG